MRQQLSYMLCFKHNFSAQVPRHDLAQQVAMRFRAASSSLPLLQTGAPENENWQSSHLTGASVVLCVQQLQQGGTSALRRPSHKRLAEGLPPAASHNNLWLPNCAS